MARPRKWKVGDFVYAAGSISGDYFVVQAATIMSIAETGSHPIKVQIDGTGDTTYCSADQVFYAMKQAKEQVTKNFENCRAPGSRKKRNSRRKKERRRLWKN